LNDEFKKRGVALCGDVEESAAVVVVVGAELGEMVVD
jgi:hypothetical protein